MTTEPPGLGASTGGTALPLAEVADTAEMDAVPDLASTGPEAVVDAVANVDAVPLAPFLPVALFELLAEMTA